MEVETPEGSGYEKQCPESVERKRKSKQQVCDSESLVTLLGCLVKRLLVKEIFL